MLVVHSLWLCSCEDLFHTWLDDDQYWLDDDQYVITQYVSIV